MEEGAAAVDRQMPGGWVSGGWACATGCLIRAAAELSTTSPTQCMEVCERCVRGYIVYMCAGQGHAGRDARGRGRGKQGVGPQQAAGRQAAAAAGYPGLDGRLAARADLQAQSSGDWGDRVGETDEAETWWWCKEGMRNEGPNPRPE